MAPFLLALISAPPLSATRQAVLEPEAVRSVLAEPAVTAQRHRLRQLAAENASRLAEEVEGLIRDESAAPVVREHLLVEVARALSTEPETLEARAALEALSEFSSRARVWHEDAGFRRPIQAFDVAAAARSALMQWRRREAAREASRELQAGSVDGLALLVDPDAARRAGALEAVATLPQGDLEALKPILLEALPTQPALSAAVAATAHRLADAELFATLLEHGETRQALRALPGIGESVDLQEAVDLLAFAAGRKELASAALLAAGRLAQVEAGGLFQPAVALLWSRLGHEPAGASAAIALGRLEDPEISRGLALRLGESPVPREAAHLVLALTTDGSVGARELLRQWVERPGALIEVHLRELHREVERWLGD